VTHYSPRYLDAICRKLHNNGEHAMKTASRIDEKGLSVQFEQLKEQLQARRLQIEQRYDQNHEISEAILRIVAKRKSELLSSMGIDVETLSERARSDQIQIQDLIDEFNKKQRSKANGEVQERAVRNAVAMQTKKKMYFPAPPQSPQAVPDWLQQFLQWLADHSQLHGQLIPPAYGCQSEQGCYSDSGTLCTQLHSSGAGGIWGWEATAKPSPIFNEIVFIYIPPIAGELTATAHVDMSGSATIYTDNPGPWIVADSFVTMKMHCGIYQNSHYYSGDPWTVIDEHRNNSHATRSFSHERYDPSCGAYVYPNDPAFIYVGFELSGTGRSADGHVDLDACMTIASIDVCLELPPAPSY
jgi:hypothetical protein